MNFQRDLSKFITTRLTERKAARGGSLVPGARRCEIKLSCRAVLSVRTFIPGGRIIPGQEVRRGTDICAKIYKRRPSRLESTIFVDNSFVVRLEGLVARMKYVCNLRRYLFGYQAACKYGLRGLRISLSLVLAPNASITAVRRVDLCATNTRSDLSPPRSVKHARLCSPRPKEPFTRRLRASFSRRLSCQISICADY